MESLTEKIERFIRDGYGNGYGYGNGDGNGDGDGYGYGYGDGYGKGDGYGNGYGDGNGDGYGNGYGYGYGKGDGYGNGYGKGVIEINGMKVYNIDRVYTCIESVHGNYAKGYTIKKNTILIPCYIAKIGGFFAHGATLYEAKADAEAKYYQSMPLTERISNIIEKYPSLDTNVDRKELFGIHNILTGSCRFGREQFCANHGVSLEGTMTMRAFIDLTINAYGSDAIKQLKQEYEKV